MHVLRYYVGNSQENLFSKPPEPLDLNMSNLEIVEVVRNWMSYYDSTAKKLLNLAVKLNKSEEYLSEYETAFYSLLGVLMPALLKRRSEGFLPKPSLVELNTSDLISLYNEVLDSEINGYMSDILNELKFQINCNWRCLESDLTSLSEKGLYILFNTKKGNIK